MCTIGASSRSGSYIKYINQPSPDFFECRGFASRLSNPRAYRVSILSARDADLLARIVRTGKYVRERARAHACNVARYYTILCNCRLTFRRHLLVSCGSLQIPTFARAARHVFSQSMLSRGKERGGRVKGFSPLIGKRSSDAADSGR